MIYYNAELDLFSYPITLRGGGVACTQSLLACQLILVLNGYRTTYIIIFADIL